MNEIRKAIVNNQEIVEVDYSNCNEDRMIEVLSTVRAIIREENKPHRVLAIFNERSFLTPKVMAVFNSERLGSNLLERQAAIGVSNPKKGIIYGHNILENNHIQVFESKEEALKYLAG